MTKDGFTHGFSMIFGNHEDRDFYIEQDQVHKEFAQKLRGAAEKVVVVDYEPFVF